MIQKSSHHFMSISTLFVNLCSGMSSKKSVDTDTDFLSFCILACDWNLSIISESACTANCQDSLFFRVNINKLLSFKYGQVNILCSTHSNLFIYRKHSLNWWMRNILVAKEDADKVKASVAELKATWDKEFLGKEPGLTVDVEEESVSGVAVMNAESTKRVITYFIICPNGVQCYDRELEGLVETSLNLGIVETTKDAVKLESLVRSSMESKKADMKEILDTCAQAVGANGKAQGGYPAWEYKVDSELRKVMVETFVEQYGKEPVVSTIHAGLECGLFLGKKPDLDCVSMGPDLLDIHSFNEKLDIASTQRTWEYLKGILAKLK